VFKLYCKSAERYLSRGCPNGGATSGLLPCKHSGEKWDDRNSQVFGAVFGCHLYPTEKCRGHVW
jgi:hypothetical protein